MAGMADHEGDFAADVDMAAPRFQLQSLSRQMEEQAVERVSAQEGTGRAHRFTPLAR